MENFIEFAKGSCSNRANTTTLIELPTIADECVEQHKELYRSYYEYDKDLLEYVAKRHTVRDYPGKYYCSRILFDIDFKEDGEICREETLDVVDTLCMKYDVLQDAIRIAFSGRGFHVSIPNYLSCIKPSNRLPQDIRQVLNKYLPDIMKIADNIFDGARLIRVANTINTKSKLYKIPLTYQELCDMSYTQIAELAKVPRYDVELPKIPDAYPELWLRYMPTQEEPKKESVIVQSQDRFNATNIVTCMQNAYSQGSDGIKGERHVTVLRMASAWRRAGLPQNAVVSAIRSWWDNDDVIRLVNDVYTKKYSPGCNDHIMKKYCDSACVYFKNKDLTADTINIQQQEQSLVKRITTDFSRTSFDLADMYKINGNYTFYPGELVTILGDTGLGKTAFVQNLCVHTRLNVLYLSLEMSDWLMYRRFCQIAAGESGNTVKENLTKAYENGAMDQGTDYQKLLSYNKERSLDIMTTRPDITNIRNIVATHKPHVLVIDHIGFLKSNINDPRAKTSFITGFLKDIAIQQECIVLAVSHIRRPSEGEALNIHMGKESSSIEQDSDKVIGIEGKQNTSIRTIKSLKSRDEGYFTLNFDVDFNTFRFMQTQ